MPKFVWVRVCTTFRPTRCESFAVCSLWLSLASMLFRCHLALFIYSLLLPLSRHSLHHSHHSLSAAVQQDGNVVHVPHTLAPKSGSWIDRQMWTNQQTDGLTDHQKTGRCSNRRWTENAFFALWWIQNIKYTHSYPGRVICDILDFVCVCVWLRLKK